MDLPSVLGGAVQGFKDFGTGVVDLFGTGGASVLDLINTLQTGKVTSQRQDDFRKWLYNTDDNKDAAAKGLGTILNGVQTVSDYIPGVGAVTRNPLFNAGQGALSGIADEFKMYGKDYDLGRAGQRALVSGGAALASAGVGDALGTSSNTLKGAARGAVGGAINQGGYTAIEGGSLSDILSSAGQGATMGGVIGGATGMIQDFKPAKTYATGLTEDEKAARMANAKNMLANEQNPERIAELKAQIKKLGGNNPEVMAAIDAVVAPEKQEMVKLYRGMSAPDDATLNQYINEMLDPSIAPRTYSGGSAYGEGYNFTPDKSLAEYHAQKQGDPSTAIMEIEVPRSRFVEINAQNKNRPADFDLAAIERGVPEDIRYETGVKDFNNYLDSNGYWGSTTGNDGTYVVMRNDALANAKRINENDPQVMQAIDAVLSPEQQAYFQDSVIRDADGKLTPVYHSSPNKFTTFDDSRLGQNTMYENTGYGHFVTTDPDFSRRFGDIDNTGVNGNTMELYADVKKPITHPYNAHFKYSGDDLDKILVDYYKATNNPDAIDALREYAGDNGTSMYDEYMNILMGGESPFEDVKGEREALKKAGYDAVEFVEGLKKDLVENSTDTTPISSYAVFSGNQLKGTNNLEPTNSPDIMEAIDAILLQDDAIGGDIISKDTARASQIVLNNRKNLQPVENELYSKINLGTLPKGYAELSKFLDTQNDTNNSMASKKIMEQFGTNDFDKISTDKLLDYVYEEDAKGKADYKKSFNDKAKALGLSKKSTDMYMKMGLINDVNEKATQKAMEDIVSMPGLDTEVINALENYKNMGVRTGYPGALDTALSERLGIAPGNTLKITDENFDSYHENKQALGRYKKDSKDIAIRPTKNIERDISAMAHERLHSFQNETDPQNLGRYSKEVTDAYKELRKDLEPFLRNKDEVEKTYKDGKADYWARQGEQESRMLQNYLDNKKITDNSLFGMKGRKEWGNEINPAFDKFFDKLRKLSKKGVALPAITALLGGGAYLTTTADEKDKEIR